MPNGINIFTYLHGFLNSAKIAEIRAARKYLHLQHLIWGDRYHCNPSLGIINDIGVDF